MNDNELKDMFLSIQNTILNLQSEFTEARDSLHNEIVEVKDSLSEKISEEISEVKQSVRKLELTLENDISKKIDALFDGRIDEIRHRKENIETNAKVADLEMRVDNLEKIIKAS